MIMLKERQVYATRKLGSSLHAVPMPVNGTKQHRNPKIRYISVWAVFN